MLEALPLEIYKLTHSKHLMLPKIHVILKSPHSHFHCNICGEFYFTGILWGYPTLVVGKPCNINFSDNANFHLPLCF